jgi:hypothetical protein
MNVVFRINGREAIPVRAIPYMAETTISADVLVRGFSRIDPTHSLYGLSAHKLLDYGVPYPMSREEWGRFAVNLQALSDSLDRQVSNGELTFAEATAKWKRESVRVLPAGVFVWKDEFQTEHSRRFRRLSDDEIVANRAHWIEATTELIASPDDSYTAELMAANGMPENWRALLQDSIDEMAAEEPFNPRQFFVYTPKWSSAKDSDSPVDVTYDPMIDRDERGAVVEGFAGFLTDDQTTDNAPMAHAEGSGELVRMLGKWFDKPLSVLPAKQRRYADIYIPKWPELSAVERRVCAIEADRKAQETIALRFQQAHRDQEGFASSPLSQRAMRDAFQQVAGGSPVEDHPQSKFEEVNLSDEQCIELARKGALTIRDWRALTGFGRGWAVAYLITSDGVFFRKWTREDMSEWSDEDRDRMEDENLTEPLLFPCTPAELLNFVDTAPHELAGFDVPEAFRRAVTESAQTTERAAHLSSDALRELAHAAPKPEGTPAPPVALDVAAEETNANPKQRQLFQEEEILRVIADLHFKADALPKRKAWKPSVKAKVRQALKAWTDSVFDKAWERLRKDKRIREAD